MKKAIVITLTLLLLALVLFFLRKSISSMVARDFSFDAPKTPSASPTPYEKVSPKSKESQSEFVPYWTITEGISSDATSLIYFGVSATASGIDRDEAGFQNLSRFTAYSSGKKTYLTIRMLDQDTNFDILDNNTYQDRVITDSISVAQEYGFDGIVLDLELKALPFDSVIDQVNQFVSKFYQKTKENNLTFSVLVYGDTFYRVRPFDVKYIGENSDDVMIMAYDFHKSGGNPGPNFPKNGSKIYGYDYLELMDDFLAVVPPEKLTIVFGLFGYDWPVDEKNVATGTGEPLSFLQITSRYIDACPTESCILKRDEMSSEQTITYTDSDGIKHVVWFEDQKSIEAKKTLLRERGINSFSTWAHSYY